LAVTVAKYKEQPQRRIMAVDIVPPPGEYE